MLFASSPKQEFTEQYGFTELLKWHKLKCVYVLAGAFQLPALKSLLQNTLTGVAIGLQKALVTDLHRGYWGPSHLRRDFTSLEIRLFQHVRPLLSVKGEVVSFW